MTDMTIHRGRDVAAQGGGAPDNRPPIVVLRDRLQARAGELKAALGNDIPVEQFIRAVVTSATINSEILTCSWQSVWIACMKACRDGLIPDGTDAAIVPFGKGANREAVYIAMYSGLLRRFRRSGQFKWITAGIVRKGEDFHHWIDESGEHFKHVPGDVFDAPMEKIYAMATTKDGGLFVTVLPIQEANKIRNMSRATREDSPWKQWPEEMYRKTALRRLCKYLPSARDLMPDEELEAPIAGATILQDLPAPAVEATGAKGPSHPPPLEHDDGDAEISPPENVTSTGDDGRDASEDRSAASPDSAVAADQPQEQDGVETPLEVAYRRGMEWKAAGNAKKAMPGEYREPSATRLALAWTAGYDGQPIPTFEKDK